MAGLPVPTAKVAARLTENRRERGTVPQVHDRVQHSLSPAGGNKHVSIGIAPAAHHVRSLLDAPPGCSTVLIVEAVHTCKTDAGALERVNLRDLRLTTVPPGAQA